MEAVEIIETSPAPWVPKNTFGARLALIRQRYGWNVKEAADACGLDAGSWHNWESGKSPRRFEEVTEQIAMESDSDLAWLRGLRGLDGLSPILMQVPARYPYVVQGELFPEPKDRSHLRAVTSPDA